jgi:hypothetical protein
MIPWLAIGCASDPGEASFLRLRGAVAPEVSLQGSDAEAVVVWVTAVDRELCVEVDVPSFAPTLFAYEVEIDAPPSLEGDPCVPRPTDLVASGPAAWGVLALVDPEPGAAWEVTADPTTLLAWFAGSGSASIGDVLHARGGRIAAAAPGFALGVADVDGADGFGVPYCRFEGLVEGLTLYEDHGVGCGGWSPVAPAGARTEFQGIDLVPPG